VKAGGYAANGGKYAYVMTGNVESIGGNLAPLTDAARFAG